MTSRKSSEFGTGVGERLKLALTGLAVVGVRRRGTTLSFVQISGMERLGTPGVPPEYIKKATSSSGADDFICYNQSSAISLYTQQLHQPTSTTPPTLLYTHHSKPSEWFASPRLPFPCWPWPSPSRLARTASVIFRTDRTAAWLKLSTRTARVSAQTPSVARMTSRAMRVDRITASAQSRRWAACLARVLLRSKFCQQLYVPSPHLH